MKIRVKLINAFLARVQRSHSTCVFSFIFTFVKSQVSCSFDSDARGSKSVRNLPRSSQDSLPDVDWREKSFALREKKLNLQVKNSSKLNVKPMGAEFSSSCPEVLECVTSVFSLFAAWQSISGWLDKMQIGKLNRLLPPFSTSSKFRIRRSVNYWPVPRLNPPFQLL